MIAISLEISPMVLLPVVVVVDVALAPKRPDMLRSGTRRKDQKFRGDGLRSREREEGLGKRLTMKKG